MSRIVQWIFQTAAKHISNKSGTVKKSYVARPTSSTCDLQKPNQNMTIKILQFKKKPKVKSITKLKTEPCQHPPPQKNLTKFILGSPISCQHQLMFGAFLWLNYNLLHVQSWLFSEKIQGWEGSEVKRLRYYIYVLIIDNFIKKKILFLSYNLDENLPNNDTTVAY